MLFQKSSLWLSSLSATAVASIIAGAAALVLVAVALSAYYATRLSHIRKRWAAPLPPGPPGEFLLGHYRLVPAEAAFKKYAEWAHEYKSDVLFFQALGTKWIVLNSLKSAVELLDRRGSDYADRPRFVMFEEMGWSPTLTWLRWGPKSRLHRKVLQPPFAKSRLGQYKPLQRKEALVCCKAMIDRPPSWVSSVRQFAVAIVLNIAYGLDVDGPTSPWVRLAEDTSNAIGKAGAPSSSLMDRIPATRYLPDWLPFMEMLRYAHLWRSTIESITALPFEASQKAMASKPDTRIFTHNRLALYNQNVKHGMANEFDLEDIKGAAATVLIAGNDTRKAQEEIDRVVGGDRLPTFDDIPNLPYLNLILQETYRMNPLSPLGIPHASTADDIYEDMFIPKGTIVYQNIWAMHHDESVYADPFRFWPERYLPKEAGGNGEPFPIGNFGFGRRICIGRDLAENSLLILLATMLATLDIEWPLGPSGKPTSFEPEWSFMGQAIVLPFRTVITARSEKAKQLLNSEVRALGDVPTY
ncbi:cytochrome P450 [Lasiosphaeria miniovina]|uniref:Cytochrome P450 n=1 Tax=Lasiosphaeria miniovina TaxID=1954250 RepID=A0AA40B4X4_9PEZI|nr:cytochrome P450 [Lasiosphaeria miniovina]KAK0727740.1 cytochrome P450 [Lasiosphaeria miniovina]